MKPHWHPLSTILLADPRCYATDGLVRMLLATERRAELVYGGDRMWPALRHGDRFTVEPAGTGPLVPGTVALVSRAGVPDLLRVAADDGTGLTLAADADPEAGEVLPRDALLGVARLATTRPRPRLAALRRIALDLRECWTGRPDPVRDPASTVREKYDAQATHYARAGGEDLDRRLLDRMRERIRARGRVLVVGSGAGRECFALDRAGWEVVGVEFAPGMVAAAREEAARKGLSVEFRQDDIRRYDPGPGSFDGVLFTYVVYSFLPVRRDRVALLRRIRSWLRPGGTVFLSARRLSSPYDRMALSLQWLALSRRGRAEWGDSHSRWIPNEGSLRRSFVHVFSTRRLDAETHAAGFRAGPWEGGHCALGADSPAIIDG